MGLLLKNLDKSGGDLAVPYPHWRSIVEAVKRLEMLPPKTAEMLHHEFENSGLSQAEARAVAGALRERVLSQLGPEEKLCATGEMHERPWSMLSFHYTTDYKTYTDHKTLTTFVEFCESCGGFEI